jgi:uncharacterized membrane protein
MKCPANVYNQVQADGDVKPIVLIMEIKSEFRSNRFRTLDLLRGVLLVLMALDHANYLIAQRHSSGEYWGGPMPWYPDSAHFLTRFVTHFCAPGFFFLMGAGMVLFADSRRSRGWTKYQIWSHFLIRGSVLIVLQLGLNYGQAWSIAGSPAPLWYVGVLVALGAVMILCIPLLDLKPGFLIGISLILTIGLELTTPASTFWGRTFDNIPGTLLFYGGGRGEYWTNYPLLAWLEVGVLGLVFGKWLLADGDKTYRRSLGLGLGFLTGFGVVRWLNGFGNIRNLPVSDWQDFLMIVKYPPSIAFVLLTIGGNLILLWLLSFWKGGRLAGWNPLLVFGKVPLFFYFSHIGFYFWLGRLLTPEGSSLGVMYLYWILGLALLYFPSRWYGRFKRGQPSGSWVRFF